MAENNEQTNNLDDFDLWGDSTTVEENDVDRTLIRLSEYLLDEVAQMFDLVQNIFNEVCSTQEAMTHEDRVKRELLAVVEATASATNTILESAEYLEKMAKLLPEDKQKEAIEHITKIYEASSFQDITGQRIKKVVLAILTLENKLGFIMEKILKSSKLKHIISADESNITKNNHFKMPGTVAEAKLMNVQNSEPLPPKNEVQQHSKDTLAFGPALPEHAKSQDDVDDIFKK
ncbi:MAG: hypothetical protein KBD31_04355 [Proteobacteria bacterium]|nr:hypothetical protein [Pseudomonadota bacterium]